MSHHLVNDNLMNITINKYSNKNTHTPPPPSVAINTEKDI